MNLKEELERLFQTSDSAKETRGPAVPLLSSKGVPIETLIDIVRSGGEVRTGIDVFNKNGVLLLEKNTRIRNPKPLQVILQNGIFQVPISRRNQGGLWDRNGQAIDLASEEETPEEPPGRETAAAPAPSFPTLETRIQEINDIKAEAVAQHNKAKENIRKTVAHIKKSGGLFDMEMVHETVSELTGFLLEKENAFSFLTREIFLSEEFLFNHSINVCTIGTVVLKHFNTYFSHSISSHLKKVIPGTDGGAEDAPGSFIYYSPEEIQDMAIGFFLHDIGKTAIPDNIINKPARLTEKEFALVKTHSYQKGLAILKKNGISNPFIRNIVKNHHAPLFPEDTEGYPRWKAPNEIPPYVKICKLADIYDAMTSKRPYEEALNPIRVVTNITRTYARKDPMLQFVLHAFVTAVGIRPPGSIVYLTNRQMAYVIDSRGPIVLPFTDPHGLPLKEKAEFIDFGNPVDHELAVDSRDPLISPKEVFYLLPSFLRSSLFGENSHGK
jgi:HD-GYP domain-containing protein (c-di-GMP phosphodiesterase class II)